MGILESLELNLVPFRPEPFKSVSFHAWLALPGLRVLSCVRIDGQTERETFT